MCVQVRSQALLQDKYQHICAGFEGHVADMTATLNQIVSPAAAPDHMGSHELSFCVMACVERFFRTVLVL